MAYSPPVTEIAAAAVIPATVIAFEVITLDIATSVWSVKENASGAVSSASVVLVKVSLTPPMVSTVLVAVEKLPLEVWRTVTVLPFSTVPASLV